MTQTHSDLGSSSIRNRPEQHRGRPRAVRPKPPDPTTGLISDGAFMKEADAFLAQATRTAREVGLVTLLVEGLQESDSCDANEQHHAGLAAIGVSFLDVRSRRDVVGRVGAAEFNWIGLLGRSSDLAGAVECLHSAVDANLDGVAMEYRLGHTLAHGRQIDLDALLLEARTHRDAPPASADSLPS